MYLDYVKKLAFRIEKSDTKEYEFDKFYLDIFIIVRVSFLVINNIKKILLLQTVFLFDGISLKLLLEMSSLFSISVNVRCIEK